MHLPAQPGAPIACDMSSASDTPEERLLAYRRLFAEALIRHERRPHAVVFTLRPEALPRAEELARREAACCPFLDYRVEAGDREVVWTTTGDGREAVEAILDMFHALAR
jgi:hypothetical protein